MEYSLSEMKINSDVREYYETVNEARPLSGFFPIDADILTELQI